VCHLRVLICALLFACCTAGAANAGDLSAGEYYNEGLTLKDSGQCELCRIYMTLAMRADPSGEVGKSAERFIRNYLARYPVPKAAQNMNNRAYGLRLQQKPDEAKQLYQRCIRLHPFFEWPYNNLAKIYFSEGDFSAARKLLNTAVAINPNYVNAWITLGYVQSRQNDIAGARSAFAQALMLDSTNEEAKERLRLCR
jgi:tetratricopeptide (TPR) repeat protein